MQYARGRRASFYLYKDIPMIITPSDREAYFPLLQSYLEHDKSSIPPYIKTMANDIIEAFNDHRPISFHSRKSTFFNDQLINIKNLSHKVVDRETIALLHFHIAKTYRYLSAVNATPNFDSSPIISFYAHPKFEEIPLSRTDEIVFGVAHSIYLEKVDSPFKVLTATAKKVELWDKNLADWEVRAQEAEGRYSDVVSGNNYLGLSHAFRVIIESKAGEADNLLKSLTKIGWFTLAWPALQFIIGLILFCLDKKDIPLLSLITFAIAVEVISVYYFRLIHSRWTTLKSQISQLELRSSLCAFVHDYASRSKDLERDVLAKFENMIFSEVTNDNSPPPSIYDAADSIAKLLTAWKKP